MVPKEDWSSLDVRPLRPFFVKHPFFAFLLDFIFSFLIVAFQIAVGIHLYVALSAQGYF